MFSKWLVLLLCLLLSPQAVGQIDLANLYDYDQSPPSYFDPAKNNTPQGNSITNGGATLGRVLFYDKNLSRNNEVSCASCHDQTIAFSDLNQVSTGWNGVDTTARHSMRLINVRFGIFDDFFPNNRGFFWDRRAETLEIQSTMPIRDHVEMGFSGTNGDPDFDDLIAKLTAIPYYNVLFTKAFPLDPTITEDNIQKAIAQFVGSIVSFDSKYDIGRAQVTDDLVDFPNFSTAENLGKTLFMTDFTFTADEFMGTPVSRRTGGGLNCARCHVPPEFDIDNNNLTNNGNIRVVGFPGQTDLNVVRSPTLRDFMGPDGTPNAGSFHTGDSSGFEDITTHYNFPSMTTGNNLDVRLIKAGRVQHLDLSTDDIANLKAFMETLTGSNVYTDPKWSNPFNSDDSLTFLAFPNSFNVVHGIHAAGDGSSLKDSDNVDLSVQRNPSDLNARVTIEVESTSPFANPAKITFVHEGAAFARSQITQRFDLFDFSTSTWEEDIEINTASQFGDSVTNVVPTGDLSRFVEAGTSRVKARVRYTAAVARAQFTMNIDQMKWDIQ